MGRPSQRGCSPGLKREPHPPVSPVELQPRVPAVKGPPRLGCGSGLCTGTSLPTAHLPDIALCIKVGRGRGFPFLLGVLEIPALLCCVVCWLFGVFLFFVFLFLFLLVVGLSSVDCLEEGQVGQILSLQQHDCFLLGFTLARSPATRCLCP